VPQNRDLNDSNQQFFLLLIGFDILKPKRIFQDLVVTFGFRSKCTILLLPLPSFF